MVKKDLCTSNGNGNETNKLLLAADQTYLSLARTMVTGTFPGPVTCETGNMLEKSLASWPRLGHPGPERLKSAKRSFLLFLLFHGFCQDGRAVAAAPDCLARLEPQPQRPVSRRHPLPRLLSPSLHPRGDAGHVPVAARHARGACRGLLARPPLLGVGGAVPRDPGLPASRRLVPPVPLAGLLRPPVRGPLVEGGRGRPLEEAGGAAGQGEAAGGVPAGRGEDCRGDGAALDLPAAIPVGPALYYNISIQLYYNISK